METGRPNSPERDKWCEIEILRQEIAEEERTIKAAQESLWLRRQRLATRLCPFKVGDAIVFDNYARKIELTVARIDAELGEDWILYADSAKGTIRLRPEHLKCIERKLTPTPPEDPRVEAAAKELYAILSTLHTTWDDLAEDIAGRWRGWARRILAAADAAGRAG